MAGPEVAPDTDAALEFLQLWRAQGPWILTAISVDRKRIATATLADAEAARAWLQEHNGQRNIYFQVNPAVRPLEKKAEREDIAELAWLHVDIDPRVGEDLQEERARALRLLQDPPGDVPPPTAVVFSGGGYQGFWALEEPYPVEGDLERAEQAKLWNLQLEIVFGADHCHNVDRIMRLPGTVNLPDRRKREKGRVPALAALVEFHDQRLYRLEQFTQAPMVQTGGDQGFGPAAGTVQVSGNVARLQDLDELGEWGVPDRVRALIAQGHLRDVEGPKQGDDSRSEWLFDAVCQLVRHEVPDDVIYSVITDPDYPISASVLDKGSRVEAYATRQIARAKEHVADPRLAHLNQRFAVVENIGGKCRVAEEQEDVINGRQRSRLTLQSFQDFRNRFMHRRVEIGERNGQPVFQTEGEWWLKHPRRRQYERLVFDPSREEVPGAYNLWRGFACEPRPGSCELYLRHLRENLCRGDEALYGYLMGWMATLVQRPARPGQVAVVLRGKRGTGKGFFVQQLGALFGRHFLHVSHASHLVGNFNSHLRDALLVFADEAFYAGDKKHESVLKTLITEDQITIEAKGVDAESCPNYVHLVLASNEQWVVPAGADERRFFVLEVGDEHKQDAAYFRQIADQMRSGGREALLHHLMTYDLEGYEVRDVPQTVALADQKMFSLSADEAWWYEKLRDGVLLPEASDPWPRTVMKTTLHTDYVEYARAYNVTRRTNPVSLGKFLKRVCPGITSFQGRQGQKRPYFYQMPPLQECRAAWDALHGAADWPEVREDPPENPDDEPF